MARLTKEQCERIIEDHYIELYHSDGSLTFDGLAWLDFWSAHSVNGLMESRTFKYDFLFY